MQVFRDAGKSIFIKVFLVLLALSFVSWGIGDYIGGSSDSAAITTEAGEISAQKVNTTYNNQKRTLEQRFNSKIDQKTAFQIGLPADTVSILIRKQLLLNEADKLGIVASPQKLKTTIENNPSFSGDNGFDFKIYRRLLQTAGQTSNTYEKELADDIRLSELPNFFKTHLEDTSTLQRYAIEAGTTLKLATVTLTQKDLATLPTPTTKDIEEFYNSQKHKYITEETRSFEALVLSLETLTQMVEISDKAIKDVYENDKKHFKTPDIYNLKQIVAFDENSINAIYKKLQAGTPFKELYAAHNGISLKNVTTEDVLPAFIKNVFTLSTGKISQPFQSELGYHIVKVETIIPGKQQSFADVRTEIKKELQEAKAEDVYYELEETLTDRMAAGEPLKAVANTLGINVQTYNDVTRSWVPENASLAPNPLLMEEAFITPEGETSNPVDLNETAIGYVQITAITPARQLSFNEAIESIKQDYAIKQRRIFLNKKAANLLAAAQKERSLINAAKRIGLKTQTVVIGRNLAQPQAWLANMKNILFSLKEQDFLPTVLPQGDALTIVQLIKRQKPSVNQLDMAQIKNNYNALLSQELEQQFMNELVLKANIKYHMNILRAIFGENLTAAHLPTVTRNDS